MNSQCPYPPVKPLPPVTEEVCYMHVKKAKDFISHSFESYGEGNSYGVIACYVEVLTNTKRGDVGTKCTLNAVEAGWEALTNHKLEAITSGEGVNVVDNLLGGQDITYDEKAKTTTLNAK